MRRTDIKLLVLVALVIGLLVTIYSCSNPKDPVDSQAPTVTITNPENNARIPNSVDVKADASDNTGVTKVEFYIDAQLFYTDETAPWSCYWTITDEHAGEHSLFAKAFDAAGNNDYSDLITVTCENLPPSTITDLAATASDINGDLALTWTAPGESGDVGTAVVYDIRCYYTELTADNWASGTALEEPPAPQEAGSAESYDVEGLSRSTTYFFAIRTQDSAGNWSGVSNNASVTTMGLFGDPITYSINSEPNPGLIIADLNGDNSLDLVVSHQQETDNVGVLINNGDGSFQAVQSYSVIGSPATLCALDVDNDLDIDFSLPDWDESDVVYTAAYTWTEIISRPDPVMGFPNIVDTVIYFTEEHVTEVAGMCMLMGNGDGTFTEDWEIFVDTFYAHCMNTLYPYILQYIVYEGDSCRCVEYDTMLYENPDPDEECMNPDSNLAFEESAVIDWAVPNAVASCAGDFNNDGWMDVVFAHYTSQNVTVMWNDGAGVLIPPDTEFVTSGTLPVSLACADLNGDTYLDIICVNSGQDEVAVLMNNGDSTFASATTMNVGDQPLWAITGDFDGDGDIDIATANYGDASVSILYNLGNGTFPLEGLEYKAGWGASSVAAADLTGDGTPEIIVANRNADNFTVLINEGPIRYYSDNSMYVEAGDGPAAVGCADFDGDGDIDVAILNQYDATISIFFNLFEE